MDTGGTNDGGNAGRMLEGASRDGLRPTVSGRGVGQGPWRGEDGGNGRGQVGRLPFRQRPLSTECAGASSADGGRPTGATSGRFPLVPVATRGGSTQLAPHPPLLPPIPLGCDGPTVTFADRIAALLRRRQKQDLFLDIGGQIQQVHDLRQPSSGGVAESRNSAWSATRYLRTPSNQSMCQEREGGHVRPPSPGTLIHCLFMVQSLP